MKVGTMTTAQRILAEDLFRRGARAQWLASLLLTERAVLITAEEQQVLLAVGVGGPYAVSIETVVARLGDRLDDQRTAEATEQLARRGLLTRTVRADPCGELAYFDLPCAADQLVDEVLVHLVADNPHRFAAAAPVLRGLGGVGSR